MKKQVEFESVEPGARFWADSYDDSPVIYVEYIKLLEETDDWNAVELTDGRTTYVLPGVLVWIDVKRDQNITEPTEGIIEYRYPNGDRPNLGICLTPDLHVDHYTLSVMSLNGVGIETIRDLIQTRHKVQDLKHTKKMVYVKDRRPDPKEALAQWCDLRGKNVYGV